MWGLDWALYTQWLAQYQSEHDSARSDSGWHMLKSQSVQRNRLKEKKPVLTTAEYNNYKIGFFPINGKRRISDETWTYSNTKWCECIQHILSGSQGDAKFSPTFVHNHCYTITASTLTTCVPLSTIPSLPTSYSMSNKLSLSSDERKSKLFPKSSPYQNQTFKTVLMLHVSWKCDFFYLF